MLRAGLARVGAADEAEVDRLYPRLLELYGAALAVQTRLYDGAEAALDRLEAAGWGLGDLHQQAGAAGAAAGARRWGSAGRFAVLLGADSLPWRKPDPRHLLETIARAGGEPARAVLVGDTVTDRDAARAAGVPCVLVGFGPDGAGVAGARAGGGGRAFRRAAGGAGAAGAEVRGFKG